jgi:hypothetical protein
MSQCMFCLCTLFSRGGCILVILLFFGQVCPSAQGNNITAFSSLEHRAQSLSERLKAHESLLAEILSRPDPVYSSPTQSPPPQPVPPATQVLEPLPQPRTIPGGRLPVPRYDQSQSSQTKQNIDTSTTTLASKRGPEIPLRNDGYYLGLRLGSVLPLDGAVRWENSHSHSGMASASMQFEDGYLAGIFFGHDFGFIRVESEYDAIFYDQKNGPGSAEVHPVLLRCIFEKEMGTRIDFRAGIGAGITLAQLNYDGKVFGGVSFCYDFLLGTGIRLSKSLALNLDYRYFLTAASDDYQRLQSNLLIASLQFDL